MVPDDLGGAEKPPREGPEAPREADDTAFAATIAPTTRPADLPHGTSPGASTGPGPDSQTVRVSKRHRIASSMESEATMAAPLSVAQPGAEGALPPLPTVPSEHYQPDKEIARGGMGRIVAAEDRRLGRQVALKELLEPAGDALGRFQREALITARLQHPGIVPVYEAGQWPSGEPFFAMKLVEGEPLDRVIARTHTLAERLALLPRIVPAIEAIAYAHTKRVIHRDLKPANVLIGKFGETVVIDWGLAKDLDDTESPESGVRDPKVQLTRSASSKNAAATLTVVGAVMGTPAYMAPEQARGEPVDQRADVFALGAMLYHLLAGVPPYNARTATDVIAAAALHRVVPIAEREKGAPVDLVAIVERAMAAEPAQRYADADELAKELQRFLTGQLVSAHRYTAGQRLARWVKKHRGAVTIGTVSIVAFAVAGTLAVKQIMKERDSARYERTIADARRMAAERLIDRMLSDVKTRLAQIGRLDLLAELGSQIHAYYGALSKTPGGMPLDDVYRMAVAVELVGRAERDSGDAERAFRTWSEVREQVATLVGDDRSARTIGSRAMIARLDFQLGTVLQGQGKLAKAQALYEQAKQGFGTLLVEAPTDRQILLHAAENLDRLGDLLRNSGKLDQALDEYSDAKAQRRRASAQAGDRPVEELLALSTSHTKIGSIHQARGETATAFSEYRNGLRLLETLLESQPDNIELQERVLAVQQTIAELQRLSGDAASAVQTFERALPVIESMVARDPTNTAWKRQHGNMLADLGFSLLDIGAFTRGLEQLERAAASQRELVARDAKSATWKVDLSRSYTRAGDAHLHLGAIDKAIESFEAGLALRKELVARDAKSVPYRRSVAWSHTKLGNAYLQKGDPARALEAYEAALALRDQLVRESPGQSGFKNELAGSEAALGKLLAARDPERGAVLVDQALGRARALVAGDPINHEWKETLVHSLIARAAIARAAGDPAARRAALVEAQGIARGVVATATQNVHWPALLAELHVALAEADPAAAAAEWKAARDLLEALAKDGRLSASRKDLLLRARTGR